MPHNISSVHLTTATLLEIILKYFGFGAAGPHLFLRCTVIYTPGIERTTLRSSSWCQYVDAMHGVLRMPSKDVVESRQDGNHACLGSKYIASLTHLFWYLRFDFRSRVDALFVARASPRLQLNGLRPVVGWWLLFVLRTDWPACPTTMTLLSNLINRAFCPCWGHMRWSLTDVPLSQTKTQRQWQIWNQSLRRWATNGEQTTNQSSCAINHVKNRVRQ